MTDFSVSTAASSSADVTYVCEACGQTYLVLGKKYVGENPWGSAQAINDAQIHHWAHDCPVVEYDTVDFCPECGEEVWRGDCEYMSRNPNASDMAREEAMSEHTTHYCSVANARRWAEWRKAVEAKEGETPRQLLQRRFEEGWSLHQLRSIDVPPDRNHGQEPVLEWTDEVERWWCVTTGVLRVSYNGPRCNWEDDFVPAAEVLDLALLAKEDGNSIQVSHPSWGGGYVCTWDFGGASVKWTHHPEAVELARKLDLGTRLVCGKEYARARQNGWL